MANRQSSRVSSDNRFQAVCAFLFSFTGNQMSLVSSSHWLTLATASKWSTQSLQLELPENVCGDISAVFLPSHLPQYKSALVLRLPPLRSTSCQCNSDQSAVYKHVNIQNSIWNVLYENGSCGLYFITKTLNRYIFRNINAIGFVFLTQHTTPFLYVKIHFGVLHMRGTDVSKSDTP